MLGYQRTVCQTYNKENEQIGVDDDLPHIIRLMDDSLRPELQRVH